MTAIFGAIGFMGVPLTNPSNDAMISMIDLGEKGPVMRLAFFLSLLDVGPASNTE